MSTFSTVAPLPADGKANCEADCQPNDPATETLRRALQASLSYGSEAWISRASGVCLASTQKQIEGTQRLSAPVVRAALLLRSPEERDALLGLWIGGGR